MSILINDEVSKAQICLEKVCKTVLFTQVSKHGKTTVIIFTSANLLKRTDLFTEDSSLSVPELLRSPRSGNLIGTNVGSLCKGVHQATLSIYVSMCACNQIVNPLHTASL